MSRPSTLVPAGRLSAVVLTAVVTAGITTAVVRPGAAPVLRVSAAANANADAGHWAGTWAAAPQLTEPSNMPPAPFTQDNLVFADCTVRQSIHVTVGSKLIRLRFSNAYGGADLPITSISVARPVAARGRTRTCWPATT